MMNQMLDPSFFHPAAWPNPACWKAVIVKQDTGDEVAAGVVFANALKSQVFTLKIAQFMGDDEVLSLSLDLFHVIRRVFFPCIMLLISS